MKLSLRTILIAGFALIIGLGAFVAIFGSLAIKYANNEISSTIRIHAENTSRVQAMQVNLLLIEHVLSAETHAQAYSDRYSGITGYAKQMEEDFEALQNNVLSDRGKVLSDRYAYEWNHLHEALLGGNSKTIAEYTDEEKRQIGKDIHDIEDVLSDLLQYYKDSLKQSIEETNRVTARSRMYMIIIMLSSLVVAILIVIFLGSLIQRKIGADPDFVAGIAEKVAMGDLKLEFPSTITGVFSALQRIVQSLEKIEIQANKVAEGDYDTMISPRSKDDSLSHALIQMTRNLKNNQEYNTAQSWLKDGLNKLSSEITGNLSLQELSDKAISYLGRYLNVGRGVLYVPAKEAKKLSLLSSYAFTERDRLLNVFEYGEGLIGQVALERKPILMKNMGAKDSEIISGTAVQIPYHTYTFPLLYEGELYGVIELAQTEALGQIALDFLNQCSTVLASYFFACEQRMQIQNFLQQARDAQAEAEDKARTLQEMNAQMEEQQQQLQQQSDILQRANAQMEEQQQQLQQQTEELQQSNAQMEEQQQQLQQQQEELIQSNDTLLQAKLELDARAKELEQSNRYKSEFLANMSHELRTPLNSILMLSKLIARNTKGNMEEDDIKKANVIHTAGEELLRLINDILDLSKIEAGKNLVKLKEVEASFWETELNDYFSQIASNKGLEFKIHNELKGKLYTDPDKVSQILRNFVSNAVKFTQKGSVELAFRKVDDPLRPIRIDVSDTGLGIDASQQKKIFEAFHQVDSSISREFGGTGLGLTIASRLSRLLGGEISLQSEPMKGSVFSLNLPIRLDENSITEVELDPSSDIVVDSSPMQIPTTPIDKVADDRISIIPGKKLMMVVEDDLLYASVLGNVIHSMDMQFILAKNEAEALDLAHRFQPVGIVLDMMISGGKGISLMDTFKSHPEFKNTPIQVISSQEKELSNYDSDLAKNIRNMMDDEIIRTNSEDPALGPQRLLIVEDNEIQRSALQEYISDEATFVKGVADQDEALMELETGNYDAVIVDLGLKQGNGLNLCKIIRKKKMNLPIIVYTGKDLNEAEEKQIKQYADRIIIKTVNSVQRLIDELGVFLNKVKKEKLIPEQKMPKLEIFNANMEGKRVLIVDDDIKNVFVLCSALEERGFVVSDAQNGQMALDLLKAGYYDLILMDIMMPVMDGYTAMKRIREDENLKHIPIIAITANALKEDRGKCLDAGANDYIAKPIDYEGLFNLIQAWINRRV